MRNLLESLRRQCALDRAHVWVDGIAHASELRAKVEAVRALQQRYPGAGFTQAVRLALARKRRPRGL